MSPSVGSRFVHVDLHVHTPASRDFRVPDCSPSDIVDAAVAAGLSAIAVTDHNTPTHVTWIADAAAEKGLTVFPGFEVNARGGHLLAIFDPSASLASVETALIQAGIPKQSWGNPEALGLDIQEAAAAIVANGGLAIAAHVDGPKGFFNAIQQGVAKERIFTDPNIAAIELLDLAQKPDFVGGKIYDRHMACIRGSDAHSPAEVGTRRTLLRMDSLSIEGVRQALSDPALRIRAPEEDAPLPYPHISLLKVTKGFLQGQELRFNPSLNCLVGGAGSGKSTIIEFIRFGLDQVSAIDEIADDTYGKLRDLAGIGAVVELHVELPDGTKLVVQRTFDDDTNPFAVTRAPEGPLEKKPSLSLLVPIHAFSQGEVIRISRSPLAQLDLLDRHLGLSEYRRQLRDERAELEAQEPGLVKLQAVMNDRDLVLAEIASAEAQIGTLTAELQTLQQAQKSAVVSSHQLWVAEKSYLADLLGRFSRTKKAIADTLDQLDVPLTSVPFPTEDTPNRELLAECRDLAAQMHQARTDARNLLLVRLAKVEEEIRARAASWDARYKVHSDQYAELQVEKGSERAKAVNTLLETQRKALHSARSRLEGIEAARKTFETQMNKRKELLSKIDDQSGRIHALRDRKAKDFQSQIGSRVALHLASSGNREAYLERLANLMRGSHAQRPLLSQIGAAMLPAEFVDLVRKGDIKSLVERTMIGENWATVLVEKGRANPDLLYRVESAPLEDLLEIRFRVSDTEYRPIEKLSTGQKATVVVLLSMVEGTQPILFDQPEDALYTPFIYTDVVRALRTEKDQRQFILATHNPNIAVGGDADLGIILEGTATQAEIKTAGGLDHSDTQSLMLLHLEGGEQAFRVRQAKFGLR